MQRRATLFVAICLGLFAGPAMAQDEAVFLSGECAPIFAETGVPVIDADNGAISTGEALHTPICRRGYALYLNNATHIPDWVAEDVTDKDIKGTAVRKNNFKEDPLARPPAGASLKDYAGSGFDRGHQAPAADFKNDQDLMDESFYLSNMAPQVGSCFNRGIWAQLEGEVRDWAETRQRLIVFTGPVYPELLVTIGDVVEKKAGDDVAVAEAFFKVVYHPLTRHAVAFLIPNEKLCSQDPGAFTTSIGHIRELTGINFFPSLRARERRVLERSTSSMWGW